MTEGRSPEAFSFYSPRPVRVDFDGGQISSDAGGLPLRAFDQRHHRTADGAEAVEDGRDRQQVEHALLALRRQRRYALGAAYADAHDAPPLRHDPILKMRADRPRGEALASQPT